MSRTDPEQLLQQLRDWDGALCRRELPAVLPRLLSIYQDSEDWSEHIRVLRIMTEMFLPHISLEDLEQSFFSKVLPKTLQFFDNLMYELTSKAKGLTSHSTELCSTVRNLLQTVVQLLETLRGCVRCVCSVQECVPLESVRSLPASLLHVIKNSFTHCRGRCSLWIQGAEKRQKGQRDPSVRTVLSSNSSGAASSQLKVGSNLNPIPRGLTSQGLACRLKFLTGDTTKQSSISALNWSHKGGKVSLSSLFLQQN